MDTLSALVERDPLQVPAFALDRFQQGVLEKLHLEFFFARCRVIVTPHLSFLTTGPFTAAEGRRIQGILGDRQEQLHQLKLFLLYDLSQYSALLETNSYVIEVNSSLVIARFLSCGEPGGYEVKLYTLRPEDLPDAYGDKIYLGRDFISLAGPKRPHFGVRYLRRSLPEQMEKLKGRLARDVAAEQRHELERDFLDDVDALVAEFGERADALIGAYPPEISSAGLARERLLDVNREFRQLKHLLCEAEALLREMEQRLVVAGSHAARYVTKLRKDVANAVNYVMVKVNGRISDAVNGIRV